MMLGGRDPGDIEGHLDCVVDVGGHSGRVHVGEVPYSLPDYLRTPTPFSRISETGTNVTDTKRSVPRK